MRNFEYDKSRMVRYLAWTFGLAYLIQAGVGLLYKNGNQIAGQLLTAAMMFVPALGVVLSGGKFSGMGWKPQFRKNIKSILTAWFAPALLTAAGALLYFLIFPNHFDLSGAYLAAGAGPEALKQLEAQAVSYPLYVLITAISSLTYAPLINTFPALGEEIGWRGFLYPQLKAKYGYRKGMLLGGIIWGAWHWPLIWLIGYEYGAAAGNAVGYAGFPILGMLIFCFFTVGTGILCDWLYERSGSIWLPALFHGAINAAATIPLAICLINTGTLRLLGPAPNGIIAGLPLIAASVLIYLRRK